MYQEATPSSAGACFLFEICMSLIIKESKGTVQHSFSSLRLTAIGSQTG